jgi:hypothetical protein
MTLAELQQLINQRLDRHPDDGDRKVVIETTNGGIPTHYMEPVSDVSWGFDWTAPYVILKTRDSVVVYKTLERPLPDFARERLEVLKSAHSHLGFQYTMKAREQSWLEGFKEGFRSFRLAVESLGAPEGLPEAPKTKPD